MQMQWLSGVIDFGVIGLVAVLSVAVIAIGRPPETSFLIRADRSVPLQEFIDAAEVFKWENFVKVAVQTHGVGK